MRVALLTYSTRPRGGVVHTLALAEALAALGAEVTVHAVGRGGDAAFFRPVDPAVTVRLSPVPEVPEVPAGRGGADAGDGPVAPEETVGARVLRSIEALAAAVDPAAHDVVHAQDCISANALADAVAARAGGAGVPVVRTVHHLDTFTTPELVRCHERAIVTPSAHVCVSRAVAAELRAGWGIEATVIPNGVDAERFAAAAGEEAEAEQGRRRWRAQLGSGLLILAVGGIEPRKGSVDLAEAVGRLQADGRRVRLVVAGGETLFDYRAYRDEFDAACARRGVVPAVLGPVHHDELPALVATADAFAFPSTQEGFGLAALEALAAGVPTVVSDLPVLREVFGDAVRYGCGPEGLAAALGEALGLPDRRRQAAGRRLAAAHRWDAAARAHLDLYQRLADLP